MSDVIISVGRTSDGRVHVKGADGVYLTTTLARWLHDQLGKATGIEDGETRALARLQTAHERIAELSKSLACTRGAYTRLAKRRRARRAGR